jgi:hypothetical protein
VQRESVEGGVGCGGGRSRSWEPFICLGRRGIGGGGQPKVSAVSKASISKSKRRGRGVGWVPLDEGNGGGTDGASPPLPSGMGGHPMEVHGTVVRQGAAAVVNRGGGRVGVAWAGMLLWAGPAWKNSKER